MNGIIIIREKGRFLYSLKILWILRFTLIGMEFHGTHTEFSFQLGKAQIKFGIGYAK